MKKPFNGMSRVLSLLLFAGSLLFVHVWWPIQAERSTRELRVLEKRISQKKSNLKVLCARHAELTSLEHLDLWAKSNGPWNTPTHTDVIQIDG